MGAPIVHFEIGCRDNEKTKQFYAELLGWNIEQMRPAGTIREGEISPTGTLIASILCREFPPDIL